MNGCHVMNEDDRDLLVICGHRADIPQPPPEPDPVAAASASSRHRVGRAAHVPAVRAHRMLRLLDGATQHFEQTQHPTAANSTGGSDWAWCYADQSPGT